MAVLIWMTEKLKTDVSISGKISVVKDVDLIPPINGRIGIGYEMEDWKKEMFAEGLMMNLN